MEVPINFKNAPSSFSFSFEVEEPKDQKKTFQEKKKKASQTGLLPFQRLFPVTDEKLKEIADNHKFGALPSKKKKQVEEGEWSYFKRQKTIEEITEEWQKYKQVNTQDYKKKRKYSLKKISTTNKTNS